MLTAALLAIRSAVTWLLDHWMLAAIVALMCLCAWGGYHYAKVSDAAASAAQQAAADKALKAQQAAGAALQAKLDASDSEHLNALQELQNENDHLRNAVAAGTQRVLVHAQCLPASTASDPAVVGDADRAELTPAAGQDVLAIRAGIIQCEAQRNALQQFERTLAPTAP